MGYGPLVCEAEGDQFPGEACAVRLLDELRQEAREVCRGRGSIAAEEFLGYIGAGVGALIAEARSPAFADVTEMEAFTEIMLETDGPYYLGMSLADTITGSLVEAFEDSSDRIAALEAAAGHIAEALVRERAAAAGGDAT